MVCGVYEAGEGERREGGRTRAHREVLGEVGGAGAVRFAGEEEDDVGAARVLDTADAGWSWRLGVVPAPPTAGDRRRTTAHVSWRSYEARGGAAQRGGALASMAAAMAALRWAAAFRTKAATAGQGEGRRRKSFSQGARWRKGTARGDIDRW